MTLKLNINFPETLTGSSIVSQEKIPCLCWIGRGGFKIEFSKPLFQCVGHIDEWDQKQIDMLAPAYGGSDFTHFNFAQLTLEHIDNSQYLVKELSLFYPHCGWISIIKDSQYSEPLDEDEDW